MDAKVQIEGMGPKLCSQGASKQHGTERITDGLVWTFGWAILFRCIGTGEAHSVLVLSEKLKDFGAVAKFAALVHDNAFIGDVGCIASQPAIEPFHRRFLGASRHTLKLATAVVGDGHLAGLAVEAGVFLEAFGVLGRLCYETEVNTESLKAARSLAGVVLASRGFA